MENILYSSLPIHIRIENEEKRDLRINLFEQNQNKISLNADNANFLSNVEERKYGLKFDFKINDKHFASQKTSEYHFLKTILIYLNVDVLKPLKKFFAANLK